MLDNLDLNFDLDGDGIADSHAALLDLDGDGTPDVVGVDIGGDGVLDGYLDAVDTNGDGVSDALEFYPIEDSGHPGANQFNYDTDGDGINDAYAEGIDMDNDGINETTAIDINGDGEADIYLKDINHDGVADSVITVENIDTNGDGINDTQVISMDDDVDGVFEHTMVFTDADGNGIAEEIHNIFDHNGDGIPDDIHIYTDQDGNGIYENYTHAFDSDGNGTIDTINDFYDHNDDGVMDQAFHSELIDTDNDGVYDKFVLGLDNDGDGIFDVIETHTITEDGSELIFDNCEETPPSGCIDRENFDPETADAEHVAGNPQEAMNEWEFQGQTNRCAVYSQKFVIEEITGQDVDIDELAELAESNGWFSEEDGTPIVHMNKLLEAYGIHSEVSYNNDISDLQEALSGGHKVIVSLDADEVWYGDNDTIFTPGQSANHAVEVIGIDNSDPDHPMVILNDSGTPDGCGEMVPADEFMDAWEDGGFHMVTI